MKRSKSLSNNICSVINLDYFTRGIIPAFDDWVHCFNWWLQLLKTVWKCAAAYLWLRNELQLTRPLCCNCFPYFFRWFYGDWTIQPHWYNSMNYVSCGMDFLKSRLKNSDLLHNVYVDNVNLRRSPHEQKSNTSHCFCLWLVTLREYQTLRQ